MNPDIKKALSLSFLLSCLAFALIVVLETWSAWFPMLPWYTRAAVSSVGASFVVFPYILSRTRGNEKTRGRVFFHLGCFSIELTLIASACFIFGRVPSEDAEAYLAIRQYLEQAIGMYGAVFGTSCLFHGIRLFSDYHNREPAAR